jgi:hypothetical protein
MAMARHLPKALFGALAALSISPSALSGPAESYADQCKFLYVWTGPQDDMKLDSREFRCVTSRGRVLQAYNYDGSLSVSDQIGLLNNNFVYFVGGGTVAGRYFAGTGYWATNFKQINNANGLLSYICSSDSSGTCKGTAEKKVYSYHSLK